MMASSWSSQHYTNVEEQARIFSDQIRTLKEQLSLIQKLASQQQTQLIDVRARLSLGDSQGPPINPTPSPHVLQEDLNTAYERLEIFTKDREISLGRIYSLNERVQDLEQRLRSTEPTFEDLIDANKALTSQNTELLRRIYGEDDSLEQAPSLRDVLDERESLQNQNDMLSRNVDYLRHGWDECRQRRNDLRKRLAWFETQLKRLQEQGVGIGELPAVADIVDDEVSVDISKFGEGGMHQGHASMQTWFQKSFFQLAAIAQDDDGDVQLEIPLEDGRVDVFRGPDEINSFFREMAATGQQEEGDFFHGSEAVHSKILTLHPPGLQFEETKLVLQQRPDTLEAKRGNLDEEPDLETNRQQQLSQSLFELDQALHERDEARSQRDKVMHERDLAILSRDQARAARERAPSPDSEAFKTTTASHNEILDSEPHHPEESAVEIDNLESKIMTDLPTKDKQEDCNTTVRELSLERPLAAFRKEYIETKERKQSEEQDNEPHRNDSTSYQPSQTLPDEESLPNPTGTHTEIGLEYLLAQTQNERDLALQQRDEARSERDAAQAIPMHRNDDFSDYPEQLAETHKLLESLSRQLDKAIIERDQALRELATRTAERNGARQRVQLLDDELRESHVREGGLREKLRLEQEAEDPMVATLQDELNGLQRTFDDRLARALADADRRRLLVVAESDHYFQQVEASNAAFLEAQTSLHEAQGKVQQLEAALRITKDERDAMRTGVHSSCNGGQDGHERLQATLGAVQRKREAVKANLQTKFCEAQQEVERLEAVLGGGPEDTQTPYAEAQTALRNAQVDVQRFEATLRATQDEGLSYVVAGEGRDATHGETECDLQCDLALALGRAMQQTAVAETAMQGIEATRAERAALRAQNRDVLSEQLKSDLRDSLATALGTANERIIVAETAIRNLHAAQNETYAALGDVTNFLHDLAAIRRELEAVQLVLQNITKEPDLSMEKLGDCKLDSQLLKATAASGEVGKDSAVASNNLTRVLAERDTALERIQALEEHFRAASARADAAEAGASVSRHIATNLTDQVNDLVHTRGYIRNEIVCLDGRIIANGRGQDQGEGGRWEEVPGSGFAQQSTTGFPTNEPQSEKGTIDHSSGEKPKSSTRVSPVQTALVESSSHSPSPISEPGSASAGHQAPGVSSPEPVQRRGSASAETSTRIWSGPRTTRNPRPNYGVPSSLKRKASKPAKRVAKKKKI